MIPCSEPVTWKNNSAQCTVFHHQLLGPVLSESYDISALLSHYNISLYQEQVVWSTDFEPLSSPLMPGAWSSSETEGEISEADDKMLW